MLIKFDSLLSRLYLRLPLSLPLYMESARVGTDTRTFVRVGIRWPR
jgi:hypothetical protein